MGFLSDLIDRGKSLLGEWGGPKPTEIHAVEHDRFDEADWRNLRDTCPPLNTMITDLSRKNNYVEEFVEDLFNLSYKGDPKFREQAEMLPTHVGNLAMEAELDASPEFQKAKQYTRGDNYGSAMFLLSAKEQILQAAQQITKATEEAAQREQDAQERADQSAQDIQDLMEQLANQPETDPNGQPSKGEQELQDKLDQFNQQKQEAEQARQDAQQGAQQAAAGMRAQMRAAADQAAEEAGQEEALMSAFGVEDGELQRMPFQERYDLAKMLKQNRLAQFYKILGQFKMVQMAESRRKVIHGADEVVGVTMGDNLSRMIPAEMLNLASPELEDEFWLRWANHQVLEYDLRGTQRLGQGPIIVVVDESGSMSCEDCGGASREAWSKALALALCDQARQKGRDFVYIGFSSSRQQWRLDFPEGKAPIAKVIEMTEHFFNGGTAYEEPLTEALEIVEQDFEAKGKPKPDIVFITDDDYGTLSEQFLHRWNEIKDKTSLMCYGVAIGTSTSGAMDTICDNVREITELANDPRNMADVFRSI